jgi:hypothetical protein
MMKITISWDVRPSQCLVEIFSLHFKHRRWTKHVPLKCWHISI